MASLATVAAASRGLTDVTPLLLATALGGSLFGVAAVAGVLALLLTVAVAAGLALVVLITAIDRF